jgi:hypothetical protein
VNSLRVALCPLWFPPFLNHKGHEGAPRKLEPPAATGLLWENHIAG